VDLTPREHLGRYLVVINANDWDALRDLIAPDVHVVDRRPIGWGEIVGREGLMAAHESWNTISPEFQLSVQLLAAGPRAYVGRYLYHGHAEHGVEWETELVILTVVESGQSKLVEMFPDDDAASAVVRFEEIGAQTEPERVVARWARLVNAYDWDGVADSFAQDFELVDRRSLGWEPLRGREAIVELYRTWVQVAPDVEMRFEVLAGDDEHIVMRAGGYGSAAADAGGGPMEVVVILVSTVRDGRFSRGEQFEADDEARALARYQELRADRR